MPESVKSWKHIYYGRLAWTIQIVHKIVENVKCGNLKLGVYCICVHETETLRGWTYTREVSDCEDFVRI